VREGERARGAEGQQGERAITHAVTESSGIVQGAPGTGSPRALLRPNPPQALSQPPDRGREGPGPVSVRGGRSSTRSTHSGPVKEAALGPGYHALTRTHTGPFQLLRPSPATHLLQTAPPFPAAGERTLAQATPAVYTVLYPWRSSDAFPSRWNFRLLARCHDDHPSSSSSTCDDLLPLLTLPHRRFSPSSPLLSPFVTPFRSRHTFSTRSCAVDIKRDASADGDARLVVSRPVRNSHSNLPPAAPASSAVCLC
jgi:hypothetical protein